MKAPRQQPINGRSSVPGTKTTRTTLPQGSPGTRDPGRGPTPGGPGPEDVRTLARHSTSQKKATKTPQTRA